MQDYLDPAWQPILAHNGLADFDALWNVDAGWFEPPNERRGGWSGVSRLELTRPDGTACAVFLKRQENHNTFSWRHPFQGIPTFLREFRLIQRYLAAGVPSLKPVCFAIRSQRALLVTEELTGFAGLDRHLDAWPTLDAATRRQIIDTVASLTQRLHAAGIQHNCYYPKHVFVKVGAGGRTLAGAAVCMGMVEARIIDLEKSRWNPLARQRSLRDLDTLNRYAPACRRSERLRFLKTYLGIARLTPQAKSLWCALAARGAKKLHSRT